MSNPVSMRFYWAELPFPPPPPLVCPGCGCTEADACLMLVGHDRGAAVQDGCRWVETDDGWRCSACVWPEDRVRGPMVDHREALDKVLQ